MTVEWSFNFECCPCAGQSWAQESLWREGLPLRRSRHRRGKNGGHRAGWYAEWNTEHCLLSGSRSTIPLQPSVFNFWFQIIHISLECSTTLSSPLGPLSHHLPILVCCWLRPGSCRATCRRAAVCLHGKRLASDYVSQPVYRLFLADQIIDC